jgi:hypothetical protein
MSQTRFALRNFNGQPVKFYRVESEKFEAGSTPVSAPAHHIFVFDVSGSMYYDLKDLKATVEKVLTLDEFNNPGLVVSLVTYSSMGDVKVHFERAPIEQVMGVGSPQVQEIRNLRTRGLTCISQGLAKAETMIDDSEITCISLHSDGYANDRSPSRENRAIQEAVDTLKAHPNVFVNTVAYRDWADFNLLAGIANQLSGTCIQAKNIKQVYQAFYDTQKLLAGDLSPTVEVGIGDADYVLFVSLGGRKVLGSSETINVRGLGAGWATTYRLYEIDKQAFDCIEQEAAHDLAVAFARAAISDGNLNAAKFALVSSRWQGLLERNYKALTATAVARMAEEVESYLFRTPNWPGDTLGSTYGLAFEGPSVLSVLQTLNEYSRHIRVHVPTLLGTYKRRGVQRIAGVRNEDGTITKPKYALHRKADEDGYVQISSVDINRNTATANIKLTQDCNLVERETGEAIHKVAGIPLDLKDFRNYTVVGDGEVTVAQLPIQTSDKRAFRALKKLGVVDGDFDPQVMLTINLGDLPLVDFDQGFDLPADTFDKLAKLQVLSKILSGVLKDSSTSLSPDQIAELKGYNLSPAMYFAAPTTTPYADLKEAIAKGDIDTRLSYKVEIGTGDITNLGKLKSGNAYLQRRFTATVAGEAVKKPTLALFMQNQTMAGDPPLDVVWGIKSLSARTKLDAVDALSYPLYAEFLGLESPLHLTGALEEAGLDADARHDFLWAIQGGCEDVEDAVAILTSAEKAVNRAVSNLYIERVVPVAFYVGSTGLVPESFAAQARTAEQIAEDIPGIKLNKAEKEEGTFFQLGGGLLLSVSVKGEYFSVSRP